MVYGIQPTSAYPYTTPPCPLDAVKAELLARCDTSELQAKLDAGCPLLHLAAGLGMVDAAQTLIEANVDIDLTFDGKTPLLVAAGNGEEEVALLLIRHGADVNAITVKRHWSALHYAAQHGLTTLAAALLEKNPKLATYLTSEKNSPLHITAGEGHVSTVELFIEKCPECIGIGRGEGDEWTPLHTAAFYGQERVALALIRAASIDVVRATTDTGFTALHIAAEFDLSHAVSALIKKDPELMHTQTTDKWHFPIHIAAAHASYK